MVNLFFGNKKKKKIVEAMPDPQRCGSGAEPGSLSSVCDGSQRKQSGGEEPSCVISNWVVCVSVCGSQSVCACVHVDLNWFAASSDPAQVNSPLLLRCLKPPSGLVYLSEVPLEEWLRNHKSTVQNSMGQGS